MPAFDTLTRRNRLFSRARTLAAAALLLTIGACGHTTVIASRPIDPCAEAYYDGTLCGQAIAQHGYWYAGVFQAMAYSYTPSWYETHYHMYIDHGGRWQRPQATYYSRTYTTTSSAPSASKPAPSYTAPSYARPTAASAPPSYTRPSSAASAAASSQPARPYTAPSYSRPTYSAPRSAPSYSRPSSSRRP